MKKRVVKAALSTALVLAMGVATLFNAGTSYAAEEVKLSKTSRNILTRQSYDFDVVGASKDAVITWESSDNKIATVDENGVVTGIKKGDVTITCKVTSAGKSQTLTATAKIRKPAVKIEIKNKIAELEYGKTYDLDRALTPKTSNDVTTWKSSNTKIATVDSNGVVKALKEGKVTITATTMSGKTDSVEIAVFGGPNATPTPKPTAKPTQKPSKPDKPAASSALYEQNFENDMGGWFDRGSTSAVKSGAASPAGGKYLEITGRTSGWNGPGYEMMNVLKAGKEYKISTYVKQNNADGEVIKLTSDKNQGTQYTGLANAATKKGEWTLLEGTLVVDKDTTSLVVYFEADNVTLDFMVDGIKVIDPNASAGGAAEAIQTVKYNFKDIASGATGYGYEAKENGNAVDVAISAQYQEVQYNLPKAVDLKDYSKIVVKLKTASATDADAIVIKVCAEGAELDQYNNPVPCFEKWGFVSEKAGELEIDATAIADKKINRITFMANNGATTATVYDVTFVPKK